MTLRGQIVLFIDDYWISNWTSPSYREIGRAVGLRSPSSVAGQLNRLVAAGILERKEIGERRIGRRVLYRVSDGPIGRAALAGLRTGGEGRAQARP